VEKKPWYEYKMLVRLLLVICYPLGLYAFGRCSNKPKVTMGIITCLVGGFVLFFAVALVQTIRNPHPTTPKEPIVTEKSVETETATNQEESVEIVEQAVPETSLLKSVKAFKTSFNKTAKANNFGYQIKDISVQEGAVRNVFQIKFGSNIIVMGTVDKKSANIVELSLLGMPDGNLNTSTEIMLCMAVLMSTVDQKLKPEDRGDLLRELKFIGAEKGTDMMDLSTETRRNGIKYALVTSRYMGIMLSVSHE